MIVYCVPKKNGRYIYRGHIDLDNKYNTVMDASCLGDDNDSSYPYPYRFDIVRTDHRPKVITLAFSDQHVMTSWHADIVTCKDENRRQSLALAALQSPTAPRRMLILLMLLIYSY